jgi:transcriptional regulator with XRE-family HTH domain
MIMPMSSQARFRTRLQTAVDAVFAGNVTAAAEGLGVSQPTLHKILTGKTRESKRSTVDQLATRLGVSTAWLIGESDEPVVYGDHTVKASVSLEYELVLAYYYREVNSYREWIWRLGKPRTQMGTEILTAFLRWDEHDTKEGLEGTTPRQQLAVACYRASKSGQPASHLEWLRASLASDVALHKLVVQSLKQAGEKPKPYRPMRFGPGIIAVSRDQ